MTFISRLTSRFAPAAFALLGLISLAGCIDSAAPILTDAKSMLGERLHLQLYGVHDGAAHEPGSETVAWRGDRYVHIGGTVKDLDDFSLHDFEGNDLLVQSMRRGKPVEYALARKIADATYLVFPIDESDADEATRTKLCGKDAGAACRVTTREQVLAFARATAAKPHSTGGLAIVMAGR
jgi:hypothetical protein